MELLYFEVCNKLLHTSDSFVVRDIHR